VVAKEEFLRGGLLRRSVSVSSLSVVRRREL
jgi:hypothetical protein